MLHESQAMMVYKFSKFQHGMAFLHRDKIGHYGLPHWVPDFENRGYVPGFSIPPSTKRDVTLGTFAIYSSTCVRPLREPPSQTSSEASPLWRRLKSESISSRYAKIFMGDETRRSLLLANFYPGAKRLLMEAHHQRNKAPAEDDNRLAEAIHSRSLNIKKLDPKSVFAAERTFLHYTHKALYVAAGGISILTWGPTLRISKFIGVLLVLTACVGLVASYAMLLARMSKILNRSTKALYRERLDDERAPIITTGVMGGVLSFVLLLEIFWQPSLRMARI
eukprot:Gregarina_sp_Pseudo_9__5009@NODE_525_length_2646_cov_3_778289_g496_i0_p2_GENE_NODE_525_length_2646_cov_3_778289_g496_i0NODE_525_length_2646_cov_3_778289_g496_i0_p2_ORF_typecomplete_len278_score46_30DUF202/PF02656_15/1_6e07VTC/PF09359_10/0_021VTC/PF09359_10/9_8e02DUF3325/PF11804_8/0_6DUF3325/PF11804_8/1_9e03_NODE_525_length_2646_cov_3_778289_g496_i0135968